MCCRAAAAAADAFFNQIQRLFESVINISTIIINLSVCRVRSVAWDGRVARGNWEVVWLVHGMQYTSHTLKLIDWHFNNCLWIKYWRMPSAYDWFSSECINQTGKSRASTNGWECQSARWKCKLGRSVWMDSSTDVKYKFEINLAFFVAMNCCCAWERRGKKYQTYECLNEWINK